jgi:hypothetical protein
VLWLLKPTFLRIVMSPTSGRFSNLKMETIGYFETLASTYQSTRRLNPKEHENHHRRESLKSHVALSSCHAILTRDCLMSCLYVQTSTLGGASSYPFMIEWQWKSDDKKQRRLQFQPGSEPRWDLAFAKPSKTWKGQTCWIILSGSDCTPVYSYILAENTSSTINEIV